jgi:hypothetical protein
MMHIDITKVIGVELTPIKETSSSIFRELIIKTREGDFTITISADTDDYEIKIQS